MSEPKYKKGDIVLWHNHGYEVVIRREDNAYWCVPCDDQSFPVWINENEIERGIK